MSAFIIYSFAAGAVSTVNPCGFALLPVWFGRQMVAFQDRPKPERLLRATLAGALVSGGFVVVFLIASAVLASGAMWLGSALPYIGASLGVILALVGLSWLFDLRLPGVPVVRTCRAINARYGAFGFGLSYGLASISCTLPVFMSIAGISFLVGNDVSPAGIVAFLAGAASVLTLTSVLAMTTGSGLGSLVQGLAGLLRRVSGGLTLVAGLYVALYWGRLFLGGTGWVDAIADRVAIWSADAGFLLSSNTVLAVLGLGTLTLVAVGWAIFRLSPSDASGFDGSPDGNGKLLKKP